MAGIEEEAQGATEKVEASSHPINKTFRRNHRKKKRLQQRKAKRARVKTAGTTLPRRIRFRRRRRLRARARGADSVDSFFSAIQVYSEWVSHFEKS